jgi:beta-galactosidase
MSQTNELKLGVCYYPEHWPEELWAEDAGRMREMGLSWVRIGEFAWSRMEPEPGRYDWAWLDRAVKTLGDAGMKIVMGTPTATPPKWMVDRDPSMLAHDRHGNPRKFGSRRHYCFSSETYRAECARIVTALAERYGRNDAIGAWQTDNEFGCHDTTLSYSPNAAKRFRQWLARRYNDISALNRGWGNVFWSMEYRSFDEIDPPNLAVTETNPSHRLDYQRFASDEVARFNRLQSEIIHRLSPGRDVLHNFMAFTTDFDHFELGRDLDAASWDSYPIGNLGSSWFSREEKAQYLRQGHPDLQAFHHDLYRSVGRGRAWVMEQQPGPVNWALYNPAPIPGMVRAWTWEAFAHGCEVVSYFRWRQVPFAQEQMHAGLNLPDSTEDIGGREARQVAKEIAAVGPLAPPPKADVALVFSYDSDWMTIVQPQGRSFRWVRYAFEAYSALRALGLDVDIVPPGADLRGYKLVVVPPLLNAEEDFVASLAASNATVLLAPRTGSKTRTITIPDALPPGAAQRLLPLQVTRVESLPPGITVDVAHDGKRFTASAWREFVRTDLTPVATFADGAGAWYRNGKIHYLAAWPDAALMRHTVEVVCAEAGVATHPLPEGVRLQKRGGLTFAVNYANEMRITPALITAEFVLGGAELPPAGVAAWRTA